MLHTKFIDIYKTFLLAPTKFSDLKPITAVAQKLGNPQNSFKSIHIGGTNGKGSVVFKVSSALNSCGVNVGSYSSPHISSITERIRINNQPISYEILSSRLETVKNAMLRSGVELSAFEIQTIIAFLHIAESNCEYGVIEVGLGGSLDATNIILKPEISAVTSISLDHTGVLGNTLMEIATHKSGIFKPNSIALISRHCKEFSVFEKKSRSIPNCNLILADEPILQGDVDSENSAIAKSILKQLSIFKFNINKPNRFLNDELRASMLKRAYHAVDEARLPMRFQYLTQKEALRAEMTSFLILHPNLLLGINSNNKNVGHEQLKYLLNTTQKKNKIDGNTKILFDVCHNTDGILKFAKKLKQIIEDLPDKKKQGSSPSRGVIRVCLALSRGRDPTILLPLLRLAPFVEIVYLPQAHRKVLSLREVVEAIDEKVRFLSKEIKHHGTDDDSETKENLEDASAPVDISMLENQKKELLNLREAILVSSLRFGFHPASSHDSFSPMNRQETPANFAQVLAENVFDAMNFANGDTAATRGASPPLHARDIKFSPSLVAVCGSFYVVAPSLRAMGLSMNQDWMDLNERGIMASNHAVGMQSHHAVAEADEDEFGNDALVKAVHEFCVEKEKERLANKSFPVDENVLKAEQLVEQMLRRTDGADNSSDGLLIIVPEREEERGQELRGMEGHWKIQSETSLGVQWAVEQKLKSSGFKRKVKETEHNVEGSQILEEVRRDGEEGKWKLLLEEKHNDSIQWSQIDQVVGLVNAANFGSHVQI